MITGDCLGGGSGGVVLSLVNVSGGCSKGGGGEIVTSFSGIWTVGDGLGEETLVRACACEILGKDQLLAIAPGRSGTLCARLSG